MVWLAEEAIEFVQLPPLLPVLAVRLSEAVPSGQLFDSVTKKGIFVVAGSPRFARPLDAAFQIPFEIIEAEQVRVDEASLEGPLDQNPQLAKAEHGNRTLPAEPDVAVALRPQFVEGVAEKAPGKMPIEFFAQGDHGDGLAHARPDELLGIGIENDVVKRLRVAGKDRSHDTVAGRGGRITEDRIGFISRTPEQTRQRYVSGPLSPLPEQMKNEKEQGRVSPCGRLPTEVVFDHPKKLRKQLLALRGGSLQRLCWQTRGVGQLVQDRLCIHRHRLPRNCPRNLADRNAASIARFGTGLAPAFLGDRQHQCRPQRPCSRAPKTNRASGTPRARAPANSAAETVRGHRDCNPLDYIMSMLTPDPRPTLEAPDDDPYLWLEEIDGERALAWVEARNTATLARFGDARFAADRDTLTAIFDRPDNIPLIARRGTRVFNFWKDASHPRGLWRATTLDSYRGEAPEWDILLDLDALAAREGEDWTWSGASTIPGRHDRAILMLSRGVADAEVLREFDLALRDFIPGGFTLPEAKGGATWLDRDTLLLSSALGQGMATHSGYARTVRLWQRGTDPFSAPFIFETRPECMAVWADLDREAADERIEFVERIGFFDAIVRIGDRTGPGIEVPTDASVTWHRGWLAAKRRTPWTVGGVTHPPDTVLGISFAAFLAGDRRFTKLFEPAERRALQGFFWSG